MPNLREMITKTYVNEVDISKVKVGQRVDIGVDAFPEKKFTGQVVEVANIGEQLRNSNAKVFEVKIEVNEFDSIVRPAMTTKNVIITDELVDVLYVPLEALHAMDSIQYVFVGSQRRQVIPGKSNENEIIIRAGLREGENVNLISPEDHKSFKLIEVDASEMARIKAEELKAKEDAEKAAAAKEAERQQMMQQRMMQLPAGAMPAGQGKKAEGGAGKPKS